ncbi:MAG: peptide MFS transporter [Methylovirgula sp.]|uniref:peptide MFS transporter n=1 Tax=Methylovirgula sp. TaxID=1978224 RepID=UPI0030768499
MDEPIEFLRASEAAPAELFGHPKGLSFLFATEMWERFSYYGMRALLVLYMTKYLLLPGHAEHVAGLAAVRHGLEFVFGPLALQPLASQIYGFYTALVYFTPILGGLLADRLLGQRRTVIVGAALMAIGHFMMAVEHLFLFALLALILGSGAFKPNISTQVGGLYPPGDARRDRAFSIFYVGINIGAFFSPLVCGTLGEEAGWHYGFAAAGVGMVIGLGIYLYGLRDLPPDGRTATLSQPKRTLIPNEKRGLLALAVLFVPTTLFWAVYEQQGNTITLWADADTDRAVSLFGWHGQIPTTWFLSINPFLIFVFTPLLVALWQRQSLKGREPSTIMKMGFGCFGAALAYAILALAAWYSGAGKASWLWLIGYFTILTLGELYLSPIGLSLVTKLAPTRMLSLVMGCWLATSFTGNFLAGWLGSFWSRMGRVEFFLTTAAIAAFAGLVIAVCSRALVNITSERGAV